MDKQVFFTANKVNSSEKVSGFFTKKKIGNLIVPVIEVYKESDMGDYIESYEIDGSTLQSELSAAKERVKECIVQLEYLNEKFGETGTTNALLSKLKQQR